MTTIAALLRTKGTEVKTIGPKATVLEAAKTMNQHRIGSLVVVDGASRGKVAGILSERDILTRIVAAQMDPDRTLVAEVMTRDVVTCTPDYSLTELRELIRERRIRHIPVVEGERLVGLVSIGDLNAHETSDLAATVHSLEDYIRSP